jgi:hypothetical protein
MLTKSLVTRFLLIIGVLQLVSVPALADTQSWTGYLIDQNSAKQLTSGKDNEPLVTNYSRQTAMKSQARKSGFELYSNGKRFKLDKNGSKLAISAIEHSIKTKGFHVLIKGEISGDEIKVQAISDLSDTPVQNVQ